MKINLLVVMCLMMNGFGTISYAACSSSSATPAATPKSEELIHAQLATALAAPDLLRFPRGIPPIIGSYLVQQHWLIDVPRGAFTAMSGRYICGERFYPNVDKMNLFDDARRSLDKVVFCNPISDHDYFIVQMIVQKKNQEKNVQACLYIDTTLPGPHPKIGVDSANITQDVLCKMIVTDPPTTLTSLPSASKEKRYTIEEVIHKEIASNPTFCLYSPDNEREESARFGAALYGHRFVQENLLVVPPQQPTAPAKK